MGKGKTTNPSQTYKDSTSQIIPRGPPGPRINVVSSFRNGSSELSVHINPNETKNNLGMDIPVGILLFFLGFTIGIIVTVSFLKLKRRKVANPDSVGNQASIHAISPLHQQIQPVTKLKQCFMDIPYLKAYGYDSKAADIGYIERNQETMGKTIEERDIDHYDDIGSVSRNIAEERSHKNDMYFRLEPLEDTCI